MRCPTGIGRVLAWGTTILLIGAIGASAGMASAEEIPERWAYVAKAPDLTFRTAASPPPTVPVVQVGSTLAPPDTTRHFLRTIGEITLLNTIVWTYNRYIRPGGGEGFRISPETWWENINNGFEWDDNNFNTNQFAHPYHGNLYFTAARANGYNFWESIPFAFGGSLQWEYFGETHHPSINDWFATSIGGTALGETLYRLSSSILDNTDTGSSRTWRELGGFVVAPTRGFNRLVTGQATRVYANPDDRLPNYWGAKMLGGLRSVAEGNLGVNDTTRVFLEFDFDYGDPFLGTEKPFDAFDFELQVNFNDASGLGRAQVRGILAGTDIRKTRATHHILSGVYHFDYIDNRAYEYGAQSVSATWLTRFENERGIALYTELDGQFIIMGAARSDYPSFTGRDYDYGPGVGFKFHSNLLRNGWDVVSFRHESALVHSINGNEVDHYLSFNRLRFDFPIHNFIGLGAEYELLLRESNYKNQPDVSQRNPVVRAFFSWKL